MKKRGCLRRIAATLLTMRYALATPPAASGPGEGDGGVRRCAPADLLGGMERFLDQRGELRLLFPDVLAAAAPFLLFRLKRSGFSGCRVQVTDQGLLLTARR